MIEIGISNPMATSLEERKPTGMNFKLLHGWLINEKFCLTVPLE